MWVTDGKWQTIILWKISTHLPGLVPCARKMDMNYHNPIKSHDENFTHLGFIKVDTILYQNESMY